jgi:hypothetical protein
MSVVEAGVAAVVACRCCRSSRSVLPWADCPGTADKVAVEVDEGRWPTVQSSTLKIGI